MVGGHVERSSSHREILAVLARAPERTALASRELAEEVGQSIQAVAARLQPLVRAGLVAKHWGSTHVPGRAYMITQEGRDYLARKEHKLPPDVRPRQPRSSRDSASVT